MTTSTRAPVEYASPDADFDPYRLSPEEIQAPPVTLSRAIRQVGPGLILAGSIVGTGELINTTHIGASVGFLLLWLVLFSCFIKVFVQIELGRHAISSGEPTLTTFSRLPGPGLGMVFVWWFVVMTLFTQLQLGAMVGGVAYALHTVFPFVSNTIMPGAKNPEIPWAVLVAVGTTVLLILGSYKVVEKSTTIMVVAFTFMTVGCVLLLPFIGHPIHSEQVVRGLQFWRLPPPEFRTAVIAASISMFGITGVGAAELVAYPYWCIEKGYARKAGPRNIDAGWADRALGWLRVMRLDAWVSMGIYTIATLAFYFLGAAVLHGTSNGLPAGVGPMTDTLASMYAPVLGAPAARWFIVIGVIAVLYSTLFASTAANARAFTDAIHVSKMVRLPNHAARKFWVNVFCFFPLIDLGLYLAVKSPVKMVVIGGFAQAMTLPMIAGAALYLRYKRTDSRLRPGKVWDFFLWLSLLAFCVTAVIGVKSQYDNYQKSKNPPAAQPAPK